MYPQYNDDQKTMWEAVKLIESVCQTKDHVTVVGLTYNQSIVIRNAFYAAWRAGFLWPEKDGLTRESFLKDLQKKWTKHDTDDAF